MRNKNLLIAMHLQEKQLNMKSYSEDTVYLGFDGGELVQTFTHWKISILAGGFPLKQSNLKM